MSQQGRETGASDQASFIDQHSFPPNPSAHPGNQRCPKGITRPASRQGIGPKECPAHIAECRPGSTWLQKKSREVAGGQGRAHRVPKGVSREREERPGERAVGLD